MSGEEFSNRTMAVPPAETIVGITRLRRALKAGTVPLAEPERVGGVLRRRIRVRDLLQFGDITPAIVAKAEAIYAEECRTKAAYPSRRKFGDPYRPRPGASYRKGGAP